MGTDDLFKKKRLARKQRKIETKTPRANSYLIVSEGEQTEPNYLNGIKKQIQESMGGQIDIDHKPIINVQGEGMNTVSLVERTNEIVNRSKIIYQNIWIIMDKDDFEKFDEAISDAEKAGYKVAWSNQSFEYWLYLHFYYSDSALHRDLWCEKLTEIFATYGIGNGAYEKNDPLIFEHINEKGSINTAIANSKRRMAGFNKRSKPSQFDPGTTVHILVEELLKYIQ